MKAVHNHRASDGGFQVMWSYGDSNSPPATQDVSHYYFGEGMDRGQEMRLADCGRGQGA
ncbi:MAG: hypothetical protein GX100_00875 [candidate division WS1 bacterium]|nr:hypothetical protein [candidate division WS1 bacterium]